METTPIRRSNRPFLASALSLMAASLLAVTAIAQQTPMDDRAVQLKVVAAIDLYKNGKTEEAVRELEALNAANPNRVDVQSWLGFLYLRTNEPMKAVPLLEAAAIAKSGDIEIANNLGNAYLATDQLDKALVQYRMVATANQAMFEPVYNIGSIYLRQKEYTQAVDSLIKAATMKPDDPFIMNNLGIAYEGARMNERAAAAYAKASDMRPDNETFAKNAGFAYVRNREPQIAVTYLERARTLDMGDQETSVALAEVYTRLNRKADARKVYDGLQSSMAENATFWFNMGVVLAESSDLRGAREAYKKSLALNPSDLDTLNNLGIIEFKLGNYSEARSLFDRLAGLNPGSQAAQINLAAAAARSGDLDASIDIWKQVVRANPGRTDIRMQLANALWQQGDYAGAKQHFSQVLASDRANAEALNGVGLFHLRADKLGDAEAAFRASIASKPKMVSAYNNLAITLERRNMRKDAIQVLERAKKIDPDHKEINENLRRMKAAG